MRYQIEVAVKPHLEDPRGASYAARARDFLLLPVHNIRTSQVLKGAGNFTGAELETIRSALTDPVLEHSAIGRLAPPACCWVVRVGYLPGVTDNVARTAQRFIADVLARDSATGELQVYTERLFFVEGEDLGRSQMERLGNQLLANPQVERVEVIEAAAYREASAEIILPLAGSDAPPVALTIELPDDDEALQAISRTRTLALSLAEMRAIRDHFAGLAESRAAAGLPPHPTDIELECLAQTWSEHCKHKIFNATIAYREGEGETQTIRSLFKTYIVKATKEIGQRVDWLVSVFHDNAGVVRLNKAWNLVFKAETHNSPSALDPYGGAITGIVGVNRDPFGTGIGAELLTNTWGYCLGSPFFEGHLPAGLHHPRRIRDGVHQGVIDGGNQSGIPYSRGFEIFDDRFIGKPLVFCGTVGLMPATVGTRPAESKDVLPGDVIVMVGGRIGKDGIHGATFSSEALSQTSPAQAVQIGDPITQKMMTDMLLEARDRELYRTLTDNGAGGLSSSVGEMAELAGGAELDLEQAPLKYAGLMPWEILLSEAQERMTLAVPPESVEALLALAHEREVEATPIGRFTASGRLVLRYAGRTVGDIALAFLHDGCPVLELEAQWQAPDSDAAAFSARLADEDLMALLSALPGRLDLCSKADKCRQYDHEVKGLSVIKPLVGASADIPADATVMRVRHGENHGVLLAEAIAPLLSDLDPGAMSGWVLDLAIRRIVAAGGRLGSIAALDNFCWPDPVVSPETPDGRQKLGGLVRSCRALYDLTTALDVPLISGKDSMKNDSVRGGVKISIPPTLLLSTIGWVSDVRSCIDLAGVPGDRLFLLGETGTELGGSELWAMLRERDCQIPAAVVPQVRAQQCFAACHFVERACQAGLLSAAHALHRGGLAWGLITMGLAAGSGVRCHLDKVADGGASSPRSAAPVHAIRRHLDKVADVGASSPEHPLATRLFAESPSRFLLAVSPDHCEAFRALALSDALIVAEVGELLREQRVTLYDCDSVVADLPLEGLRTAYQERLRGI